MNCKFFLPFLLIYSLPLFAQRVSVPSGQEIKIISSDRNSIVVEYTPIYSDSSTLKINGQSFIRLELRSGYIPHPEKWGEPAVPERIINIGVPSETGNTIQVLSSSYKVINGNISPKPKLIRDSKNVKLTDVSYEIGKNYNNPTAAPEIIRFGEYGLIRSIPVQSIIVSPFAYNAGQRAIKIYTKIIFQIKFSQSQNIASKPADNFLSSSLLNFNVARNWGQKSVTKLQKKSSIINSVLSGGTWVRFEAPTEGIYKITKTMLPTFGIDPSTVDPRTIKIYNNGGKVLPEGLANPRPSDLVENAILVVGQDDGKFDDSDYILFYGRGNDFWDYDTANHIIKRYYHPYSNQNYYWITSGGNPGKRMQQQTSLNVPLPSMQTSTKAFVQWDKDEINIGQSGREYYGDNFSQSTTSRTYPNKLNNRIDSYPVQYNIRFINASSTDCNLEVDESSTPLFNQTDSGFISSNLVYFNGVDKRFSAIYNGMLSGNNSLLKFVYTPTSASSIGYLDYFEIQYQSQLQPVNDQLLFFSQDTSSIIQYNLSDFNNSNISVFNISSYASVSLITNYVLLSGSQCSFQTNETAGEVSKYFAVASDGYLTPVNATTIQNSNLHGIQTGAKFIIITNKVFEDAAQRLKTYKASQAPEPISTIVVDVDQIFNEFSCGMTDPTAIRDFIEYAYSNWKIQPYYVLFFGKGTYDPKDVEGYHDDYVPAYETQESLDQVNSYTTDDYYVEVSGNDDLIDLAYGRLTVTTTDDANTAVDKIIQYETQANKGTWRNLITLVTDGPWTSTAFDDVFTQPSEYLASLIPTSFDLNKVYLATYPVVFTSDGRRIPDAASAIVNSINNGTLLMNYIGHGSPQLWSYEQVFVQSTTIPQLNNNDYFLLVTATCDFGYWDIPNPTSQSSAEELVLLNGAGCIASVTASRLVYEDQNVALDDDLFAFLLQSARDSVNLPVPLGQAVFSTKQIHYDVNSQKYELLGDPTVRLLIPQYNAVIDSINGQSLSDTIQIKALSNVRVSGEIKKTNNTLWNDFNGTGVLTMFDSQRIFDIPVLAPNGQMVLPGGIIFRGNISVTNGKFSTSFIVPKDISYENQNGKIILYFSNTNSDGIGYSTNIIVGGTDSTAVNNKIGPDIRIFFDDTTTANAELANSNSTLIVKLIDPNGLNTTGTGVGHKLEGILNGQDNNPIDFTNYFTSDINSGGRSGVINYKFSNLDPGNYTLKVIAWDVFNNSSSKTVNFQVVNTNGLVIEDVYNYPDPFASNTTFTFQQNVSAPINVKIKVYTIAGRLVRELEKYGIVDKFVKVDWDGRDKDGDILANGTYLYKIIVQTVDGQLNQSALGKLAIVR